MINTTIKVLNLLRGVRGSAERRDWIAFCPAHEDRKQRSLSVRERDGKVILHCFTGCQTEDVIQALNLEWGDLFEDDRPNPAPRPRRHGPAPGEVKRTAFELTTPTGELVAVHTRIEYSDGSKQYRWSRNGKPNLDGMSVADVPLWGIQRLYGYDYATDSHCTLPYVVLCYTPDTELLTSRGWVLFPDLHADDEVAQYEAESGQISFVQPEARQRFAYSGELIHVQAEWCDLLVTPDHRMLTRWRSTDRPKPSTPVVLQAGSLGRNRELPVAGILASGQETPIPLTAAQSRLLVSWVADGGKNKQQHVWNLKKSRKTERLSALLTACDIPFAAHEYPSTPGWTQITIARSAAPFLEHYAPNKCWHQSMARWPYELRAAMLSELSHWDGDKTGPKGSRFFTARKDEADAVAAVAAVTGYDAIQRCDTRDHRPEQGPQYIVNLSAKLWRQFRSQPTREGYSGPIYCCTVPDGFLVVRRNGKTVISGNCEGEKAALSLWERGIPAVGTATGASTCPSHQIICSLDGYLLYLWPDNDAPGRKHVDDISRLRFSNWPFVVRWPGSPPHGDAADFPGDARAVWDLLADAAPWSQPEPEISQPLRSARLF